MSKGFSPILVLVIVLILGSLSLVGYKTVTNMGVDDRIPSYNMSPTLDSPENWEEYNDNKHRITFRYPKTNYKIVETNETFYANDHNLSLPGDFIEFMGYSPPRFLGALKIEEIIWSPQGNLNEGVFQIWIFENLSNLSIEEWYKKYGYYPFHWGKGAPSVIENEGPNLIFEVDSLNGQGTYVDGLGKWKNVYVKLGTRMYLFSGPIPYDYEENTETLPNIFDQILSTFEFTN